MLKLYRQAVLLTIVVIVSGLLFSGCGSNTETGTETASDQVEAVSEESVPAGDPYTGTAAELLGSIINDVDSILPKVSIEAITPENAPATLGLLADDFASFISEGTVALSDSDSVAFQAAVVQCRYADDAGLIEELIQEGFDPGKWVYVFPDRALTAVYGSFLLLAVGSEAETQALADAFEKNAGGLTSTRAFYEGETGG